MSKPSYQSLFLFWSFVVFLLAGFVWVFQSVLFPFVLGAILAYALSPVVNDLVAKKMNRLWASLLVILSFMVFALAILVVLIPVVYQEIADLIRLMPVYIRRAEEFLRPYLDMIRARLADGAEEASLQDILTGGTRSAADLAKGVASGLAAGGAFLNRLVSILVIAPVVAFFVLKEWPAIMTWCEGLMPRPYKKTIMDLLAEMNRKLSGFIRGQLLVALILAISYAVALTVAGLNYSILIGLLAGLLNIIPLLGSTVGLLISVSVAWFQTGDWQYMLIIAAIFLTGQLVEGNFLTPKLLGSSVGMHPLWVFFALLAGGALAGVVGMLLAVPVAAVVGVLLNFAISQYKASAFYRRASEQKQQDGESS